jgi:23S rRNA (guanosine2251-2'-O)-methyltransferase
MAEKRGFGSSGRNEGYKGASRGSRPADSRGGKPTDTRGPRTADARGPRTADSRGGGFSDFRSGAASGTRSFGSADAKGSKPAGDRYGKTSGERYDKPAGDRYGKAAGDRYDKPVGDRYGKPAGDRFGKPAGDRYSKPSGDRFAKPAEDSYKKPAGERYSKSTEDNYKKPAKERYNKSADERYSKPAKDRYEKTAGARGSRPADSHSDDFRVLKRDIINEDRISEVDDSDANQGDLDKLEGRNSVMEALKAGRSINRIFVAKGEREGSISQIIALAKENRILIQEIDRAKLDAMSVTFSHQGVIALTAAKDYVEVDEILASAAESGRPPFLIILDEITDSHNLGSILRTANAAGVHGIIIPKRRAIGLTSVVSKASAGAIEYVPVARVTNIVQTIQNLKKQNIWVVGTDSSGGQSYFEKDLTGPVALVIGSEGEGMGKLVRESCDFVVNIPMMGQISSLNAAVAGAIVTYEIVRQRSKRKL